MQRKEKLMEKTRQKAQKHDKINLSTPVITINQNGLNDPVKR